MNPTTLNALRDFPDQLEAHFLAFPLEYRHWAPDSWMGVPSEALTATEQVCHVRDIEIEGYHVRLHRTLTESNPVLASIDTDAFARDRNYGAADPLAVLAAFRRARKETMSFVERLTPEQLRRPAEFEGYGHVSFLGLIHFLCSHDQQHLAGLQWLLGKLESGR
jgi:hypothetical protein